MEDQHVPIASAFLDIVRRREDARPGEAFGAIWRDINRVLDPVLGKRGVAALFKRTLLLAQAEHPWVTELDAMVASDAHLEALAKALGAQPRAEAAEAGASLLSSFCRLLASLIGPALTERLLRPVLSNLSSGSTAWDESS